MGTSRATSASNVLVKTEPLQIGDRVALSISEDGEPIAQPRPVQSVAERTFGAIKARKRPEDFKELRRLFMEGQVAEVIGQGTVNLHIL